MDIQDGALTMKRFTGICLSVLALTISMFIGACGSGTAASPAVGVSVSSSAATINAGGTPATITATVANDSTNAGVTWSLASNPSSLACGTFTSSGLTATFTPPAESVLSANCKATITATSVKDGTKASSTVVTVDAVAVSLPSGESTTPTAAAGEAPLDVYRVHG